jgi:hypothetical protein
MELNTQRVTDAINHLIEAPNYIALVRELNKIIETWSDHPMGLLRPAAPPQRLDRRGPA